MDFRHPSFHRRTVKRNSSAIQVGFRAVCGPSCRGITLVADPHAAAIHVTVVAHQVGQCLVARVSMAQLHAFGGNGVGQTSRTLNLKPVRENRQHDIGAGDAVVPVDQGIDQDLAQNLFRIFPALPTPRTLQPGFRSRVTPNKVPASIDQAGLNYGQGTTAQRDQGPLMVSSARTA